jgi:hypothetical protein
MSGSNSSDRGSSAMTDKSSPLSFTVHSMPSVELGEAARRTSSGRLKMLLVLLVCAAPVVASYFSYFVIRPEGRTNYSELIEPIKPIPDDLPLVDLQGRAVKAASLKGQWLLVVVSGGACDVGCEHELWIQRQLRETLGRDKDRLDKVWLIIDAAEPRAQTLQAVSVGTPAIVLRVAPDALARWLTPASGHTLDQHMVVVDPLGNWMMRAPAKPEPAKLKRDVEKLMRASAGWDKAGR